MEIDAREEGETKGLLLLLSISMWVLVPGYSRVDGREIKTKKKNQSHFSNFSPAPILVQYWLLSVLSFRFPKFFYRRNKYENKYKVNYQRLKDLS